MLQRRIPSVKPVALESGLILAVGVVLAVAAWASGFDASLAQALFNPDAPWTWLVRQWSGVVLCVPVVVAGLSLLVAPMRWRQKNLNLHQTTAVLVISVVLGMGLISQVTVGTLADRARPRESVLALPGAEALHGHSMPSGHAAMGFAFVAPYFLLRRKRPAAAKGWLAFGLVSGGFIGLARIIMGAHFFSDVLMAAVIALAMGPWWAFGVEKAKIIGAKWWAGGVFVALLALVLGNNFTLGFDIPLPADFKNTALPCPLEVAHEPEAAPHLTLVVTGYGAPVSQIYPVMKDGIVSLRRWGLYHGLACRAVLHAPAVSYD